MNIVFKELLFVGEMGIEVFRIVIRDREGKGMKRLSRFRVFGDGGGFREVWWMRFINRVLG